MLAKASRTQSRFFLPKFSLKRKISIEYFMSLKHLVPIKLVNLELPSVPKKLIL